MLFKCSFHLFKQYWNIQQVSGNNKTRVYFIFKGTIYFSLLISFQKKKQKRTSKYKIPGEGKEWLLLGIHSKCKNNTLSICLLISLRIFTLRTYFSKSFDKLMCHNKIFHKQSLKYICCICDMFGCAWLDSTKLTS